MPTALLIALSFARLAAQAPGATLTGVVSDESGAVVAHVDLTLADAVSGVQRRAVSTDQGVYVFAGLPPGTYVLMAGGGAFAPVRLEGITLAAGDQRSLALTLKVSPLAESVSVTADNATVAHVARGATVGILGDRDILDTPFSQTSYTAALMQDQQARFAADAVKNDPAAYADSAPSSGLDNFTIRGFSVSNADVLFNGMVGVSPTFFNSMMSESVERIDVLKGPSALLYGAAPGGSIGGVVNAVAKRAGETPLARLTADFTGSAQGGGHVDLGRRFGANKQLGLRFNGVYRDGDTAVAHQSRSSRLATLGTDYRRDRVRLSSDVGYQRQDLRGTRRFSSLNAGIRVPAAPRADANFFDPFEFTEPEVVYGMGRGEVDLGARTTAFVAAGGNLRRAQSIASNRRIVNERGDLAAGTVNLRADRMWARSLNAGVRSGFTTGLVRHEAVISYTGIDQHWWSPRVPYTIAASNIYTPTFSAAPDLSRVPRPDADPATKIQVLEFASLAVGDTMFMRGDAVQVTVGVRAQEMSFPMASRDDRAVTPMLGVVVKPRRTVSLYGNYIEGLQQGGTAPLGTVNEGEVFPPFKTAQYEGGIKLDIKRHIVTAAVYQMARPNGYVDPCRTCIASTANNGTAASSSTSWHLSGRVFASSPARRSSPRRFGTPWAELKTATRVSACQPFAPRSPPSGTRRSCGA